MVSFVNEHSEDKFLGTAEHFRVVGEGIYKGCKRMCLNFPPPGKLTFAL